MLWIFVTIKVLYYLAIVTGRSPIYILKTRN